jgi:hypothetical protein
MPGEEILELVGERVVDEAEGGEGNITKGAILPDGTGTLMWPAPPMSWRGM